MSDPSPDLATSPSSARRGLPLPIVFLVFALAWVAHAKALQAGWVLDDRDAVRDSAIVSRGVAGMSEAFGVAWEGEADRGAWRPLTVASYGLDAAIWRTPGGALLPFGFHLTNVFLHAVCAVLLLAVVQGFAPGRPWLAAGTAVVFAVHPLHASTVAALVGRADLLALLFSLIAMLLWARGRSGHPAFFPLAAPAFLLALLAKETALALPLVLLVLDAGPSASGDRFRRSVPGYAFLAIALFLYFLRWPGPLAPFPATLAAGVAGLGRLVLGVVMPIGLVEDRFLLLASPGGPDSVAIPLVGGAAVVVAAVGLVALALRRRIPVAGTAVLLTALATLVGAVVAPEGAPLEARFAYVAGPALFLWAGLLLEVVGGARLRWRVPARVAAAGGALAILVLLTALTWIAEEDRRSDHAWHLAQIERQPTHLALQLRLAERLREAAEADTYLATTLPASSPMRGSLLTEAKRRLVDAGTWAAAVERRTGSTGPDPLASEANRQLGFAELEMADVVAAVAHLQTAIRLDSRFEEGTPTEPLPLREIRRHAEIWFRLGRAQHSLGDAEEAAESYRRASRLAPHDVELLRQAARALVRARRPLEAAPLLREARNRARSPSVIAEIERELAGVAKAADAGTGQLLRDAGEAEQQTEYREALRIYEAVLRADSNSVPAWYAVARLRGVWFGDYRRARVALDAGEGVLKARGEAPEGRWGRQFTALREAIDRQEAEEEAQEGQEPPDDE